MGKMARRPSAPRIVHLSEKNRAPSSAKASAVSVLPLSDQPATTTPPASVTTLAECSATAPRWCSASCSAGRITDP